ncbi:MAG: hypothetical protein JW712_06310, partial [Dehalococcoidales bacterium]|nr:hypothetical protein [Dehalococcoidales bacterium]
VDYPRENFFGDTSILDPRNYIGRDPDGWFAPEHNVHGEITIWTPETLTLEDVQMNYDYLNDIANPWLNPGTMTVTPIVVDLGGTPFTFNEYLFEWEVITDAQSIWSLILPGSMGYFDTGNVQDGYYIPIPAEANFMWSTYNLPIQALWLDNDNDGEPDTQDAPPFEYYIQADLNDPAYCTEDGNYFYYGENLETRAMPNHFDLTLFRDDAGTLVPFYNTGSGTWWDPMDMEYTVEIPLSLLPDFTGNMVLRTYATDFTDSAPYPSERGGSGIDEIYEPASTDFTIIPYATEPTGKTPGDSIFYANWQLTPITGFNHGDVATLDLGEVWDLCGHNGGATPTVTFEFVADYDGVDTDELLIYHYEGGMTDTLGNYWPNNETAPYVQAGDYYGIEIPIDPYLRNTAIEHVYFDAQMLENFEANVDSAEAHGPTWRQMTYNNAGLFYYESLDDINEAYVDGDQLYTRIKIEYFNGSEWTSDWIGVGARTENFAIVDGVVPYILQYGIEL